MRRNRIASAVAALTVQLSRPRYLRIVARILVHDRRPELDGTRCPCCNSPDAEIVRERALLLEPTITILSKGDPDLVILRVTFGLLVSHDRGKTFDWVCEQSINVTGGQVMF